MYQTVAAQHQIGAGQRVLREIQRHESSAGRRPSISALVLGDERGDDVSADI
jgi:hypothetical protein